MDVNNLSWLPENRWEEFKLEEGQIFYIRTPSMGWIKLKATRRNPTALSNGGTKRFYCTVLEIESPAKAFWPVGFENLSAFPSAHYEHAYAVEGYRSTSTGCICKHCHSKNEYAAPNQKDGGYVCYECR